MAIAFRKRIIALSKEAAFAANKYGLVGQYAQEVLMLAISASMNALYKTGVIQAMIV